MYFRNPSFAFLRREKSYMLASDACDEEDLDLELIKMANTDAYNSLEEVTKAITKAGVDNCGLIFGIDYTLSNKLQGQKTYSGKCLHDLTGECGVNPYQEVICILGETLEPLDDDGIIPAYGFGDKVVKDKGIFPLKKEVIQA